MLPDKITIGDKYGPTMNITDQAEADRYFAACVEHTMRVLPTDDRAYAERVERSNLGYYAGYYSNETRERVERQIEADEEIATQRALEKGHHG